MSDEKSLQQRKQTASERFSLMVEREYNASTGILELTQQQRFRLQSYFVKLDSVCKMAEIARLKKKKNQDPVPVTLENVNYQLLATSVIACVRMGLDPACDNHVHLVPYKNNSTGKYDITIIIGYKGLEITAKKYGLDVPDNVVIRLVHATDNFTFIQKDNENPYDGFIHKVNNPFDRGEVLGGYYYFEYKDNPAKNKLVVMSKAEIEKRKPAYASVEFWGGEKDKWENGQVVGKEKVDGWNEQMCYKTLVRAAYKSIPIDPSKIDADFIYVKSNEDLNIENKPEANIENEIQQKSNTVIIDADFKNTDDETSVDKKEDWERVET